MTKEMILGILIPFAGTSLGAGCVFLMRQQLGLRVRRGLYVGDQVTLELWRDGERLEVTLTLDEAAS